MDIDRKAVRERERERVGIACAGVWRVGTSFTITSSSQDPIRYGRPVKTMGLNLHSVIVGCFGSRATIIRTSKTCCDML